MNFRTYVLNIWGQTFNLCNVLGEAEPGFLEPASSPTSQSLRSYAFGIPQSMDQVSERWHSAELFLAHRSFAPA